jgi:hypothetical protein
MSKCLQQRHFEYFLNKNSLTNKSFNRCGELESQNETDHLENKSSYSHFYLEIPLSPVDGWPAI